ncbi:hypothetical protein HMPREF1020_04985 [Clostridium sp. 7_3_54FAA]|nr:hypothetical protein HMPREF1020_04985 [Clostridium sp. 7_3_54FAA]
MSCLKQIVTTRLFGLGIAIIVFAFICYKESKTMQAIFKDGSKVSFKGE